MPQRHLQPHARHRTTSRLFTAAGVALVVALSAFLVGVAQGPSVAATKTFKPAKPRTYLKSVTVTSTPKAWRFAVRTKKPKDVIGYELYIDIGTTGRDEVGPGADYILQSVLGTTRFYKSYDGTRGQSEPANCLGKRSKPLADGSPGRVFILPQTCIRNFDATTDTTGGTVGRLRVRAAVIGAPQQGNCVYNWSPRAGRKVFHGWVKNDPKALQDLPMRTTAKPVASASARRGC